MAFDKLLYFHKGLTSGHMTAALTTDALKIDETPVAGLGINVVIPTIPHYDSVSLMDATATATVTYYPMLEGLQIDIYESDDNITYTLIKTMPGCNSVSRCYDEAGSFWDRFYTDKDWVRCHVDIVSTTANLTADVDFGKVDIRLTDRFAKYAGT